MNRTLTLAAALALSSGLALAQTAAPPASPGNPSTPSGSSNPAVNMPNSALPGAGPVPATLEAGANSFTEGQARGRIGDAGFMDVKDLVKDDQGVWRGKAMKDGKSFNVGIDYKGNIGWQ